MRKIVRLSVWVVFLIFFIGTIAFGIISQVIEIITGTDNFNTIFSIGILGALIAFIMYGLFFLIPLLFFLIISTSLFINNTSRMMKVGNLFFSEFILIGILFTYFAIKHNYPSWYFFIAIFGISQFWRYNLIKKESQNL